MQPEEDGIRENKSSKIKGYYDPQKQKNSPL
jgi:hypothetical protein